MTDSAIRVRTFDEDCIPRFVELAATYYPAGHDARNPTYLRWAFLKNPCGAARVAFAEGPGGRWSGMMAMVPFRVRHGAREFVANIVVNVLVHPDHRNEKLFVRIIQQTCSDLAGTGEWLVGHPNENAVRGWRRTNMGFRPGYDVRVVPPLLRVGADPGSRVTRAEDPLLGSDFSLLRNWQTSLEAPVLAADADFLRWRFLTHPTRRYRVYVYRQGHQISGYRVDRQFRLPVVRWVIDWQGADAWASGPARGPLPAIVAWPATVPPPKGAYLIPRARKTYYFFATPCDSFENDGDPWSHVTLAASDFV